MKSDKNQRFLREAVGIFMEPDHLKAAIRELRMSGFGSDELGLLAREHAVEQKLIDLYTRPNEPPASGTASELAFVDKESTEDTVHGVSGGLYFAGGTAATGGIVASAAILGGPLAVAIAGAIAVGAVGAMVGGLIAKGDTDYLREQLDEGHVLLFVHAATPQQEEQAEEILKRHAALEVRVYDVPVKTE